MNTVATSITTEPAEGSIEEAFQKYLDTNCDRIESAEELQEVRHIFYAGARAVVQSRTEVVDEIDAFFEGEEEVDG
jgi:hypothetical protein